jgi:hypothetical protein
MPAEPRKAFLIRIDPQLWADLEAWAQEELRSVNGQIEFLLRQAVQRRKRQPPDRHQGYPADPGESR